MYKYLDQMNGIGNDKNNEETEMNDQSYLDLVNYGGKHNQFGIESNPNVVNPINYGNNMGNDNNMEYILIGIVSILLLVLICVVCIGIIYSMVGFGYFLGKSQRNGRRYRRHGDQDEDKEAGYYEVKFLYI